MAVESPVSASWNTFLGLEPDKEPLEPLEELRSFMTARLSAAVDDILLAVNKTVARYQDKFNQQKIQEVAIKLSEKPPPPPPTSGVSSPQAPELTPVKSLIGAVVLVPDQPPNLEPVSSSLGTVLVKQEIIPKEIFVKEEPKEMNKDEVLKIQELSVKSLKLEEPVDHCHNQIHFRTEPENMEESMEWQFEGLGSGASSGETEDSEEEQKEFMSANQSLVGINLKSDFLNSQIQMTDLNTLELDADDEVTENSSDYSDTESMRAKAASVDGSGTTVMCVLKTKINRKKKKQQQQQQLTEHICTVCKKSFSGLQKLSVHMSVHKDTESCSVCNKVFKRKTWLNAHMKKYHEGKKSERTSEREEVKKQEQKREVRERKKDENSESNKKEKELSGKDKMKPQRNIVVNKKSEPQHKREMMGTVKSRDKGEKKKRGRHNQKRGNKVEEKLRQTGDSEKLENLQFMNKVQQERKVWRKNDLEKKEREEVLEVIEAAEAEERGQKRPREDSDLTEDSSDEK